jgi:hypothetical protein
MRGAMTGGLGALGFGLTWMGMESLFARISTPLAFVLLACAAFSLGMAFSEARMRPRTPWLLAGALAVLGLVAFGIGAPGWYAALLLLFAVAYTYLGLFVHWQSHPPHLPHPHLPHFKRARM